MGLNKEEDVLSFLGRHIHLSLSVEQCHREQGLSHMMQTVDKHIQKNQVLIKRPSKQFEEKEHQL